ncbi:MAG TPA: NTP transferase domain-containing protein [Gaiellaceae bacterium]|jgi:2-phospho-L-lactate guanylyltransferase
MPTVVVPFRGAEGKSRLNQLQLEVRIALNEAMLADVLAACATLGETYVVSAAKLAIGVSATIVADPGRGQGAAVVAGLDAAVAAGAHAPYLVVNADLPCVTPRDVLALSGAIPDHGLAVARATDGTTNALALASAGLFAPVYGPDSAVRFLALAPSRVVDAPNLIDDVDTVADLLRLGQRLGPHTRELLARVRLDAAA